MNQGFDEPTPDSLGGNGDDYDGRAPAAPPQGCAVRLHAHSCSMPVLRGSSVSSTRRAGVRVRFVRRNTTQGSGMSDFPPRSVRLIR